MQRTEDFMKGTGIMEREELESMDWTEGQGGWKNISRRQRD